MRGWRARILKILGFFVAFLVLISIALVIYVQLAWNRPYGRSVSQLVAPRDKQSIARGEYLFKYGNQCWACHTHDTADANTLPAGGREFDLRRVGLGFGVFYGSNITPDPATGIGAWSDGELARSIREGLDKEGRPMFPIMPTDWYKGLSDRDVLAIVAYMRSLPPVQTQVPPNRPSFFAKALLALRIVRPQPAITQPVTAPPAGPTANYGQYLANHASACAECHSPRDLRTGKYFLDRLFTGSTFAFGGALEGLPVAAYAPNVTFNRETGIGSWTEEQFIAAMRTGTRPGGTVMLTVMPWPYYSFWTADDLQAVYRYLKTVPAQKNRVPAVEFSAEIAANSGAVRGEALFKVYCAVCHGERGKGAAPTTVSLAQISLTVEGGVLRNFIANGVPGSRMPAFSKTLTPAQLSNLLAFMQSWK